MIFGKHINKYYFKYAHMLILGILALLFVDLLQLEIPELYRMVINGIEYGEVVMESGEVLPFDMHFLVDEICRPMLYIVLAMVFCRFLWRVCLFGAGIKVEPIGFLICKDDNVRMINISKPAEGVLDRAIEKAPDVIDMLDHLIGKYVPKKEDKE